jgi:hypothetical protein
MRISGIASLAACGFLLAAGAAMADTPLPHQKLGLWQQVITTSGKSISDQVCLDAAAEAKLSGLRSQFSNANCQSRQVNHNRDGTWSIDSTCTPNPGWKITSHIVVTGDFNSKFTAVIDSTNTGAPLVGAANGKHRTTLVSTWLGRCKPGQRGGDVIMSNGTKINVLDLTKAKP